MPRAGGFDVDPSKAQKLKAALKFPVMIVDSIDELLAEKPMVIVEAASQQAVKDYITKIVSSRTELIVMSTGALLGLDVNLSRVHFSSGAIGGVERPLSAILAGVDEVILTSEKTPKPSEYTIHRKK